MTRLRALILLALFVLPTFAAPEPAPAPTPTPAPKRYRIGDTDQPHSTSVLQRIENALPLTLLIFLGIRAGHVQVGGTAGNTSASVSNGK